MKSPNVVLEEYTARDERRLLSIQARRCLDRSLWHQRGGDVLPGPDGLPPGLRRGSAHVWFWGNTNSPLNGGTHCCHTADRLSGRLRLRRRPAAITVQEGLTARQRSSDEFPDDGRDGWRLRPQAARPGVGRRGSAPGRGRRQRAGRGLPFRIHAGPLRPAGNGWEASAAPAMPPDGLVEQLVDRGLPFQLNGRVSVHPLSLCVASAQSVEGHETARTRKVRVPAGLAAAGAPARLSLDRQAGFPRGDNRLHVVEEILVAGSLTTA